MKKRLKNITDKIYPVAAVAFALLIWQLISVTGGVKAYLLPSPARILLALAGNMPDLMRHARTTLFEAFAGLLIGVGTAFIISVLMDRANFFYKTFYPMLVVSQTIPAVAVAPLLVLWLGYGVAPKIALVVLVCFFPIAVGMSDGFKDVDRDAMVLLRAMGATPAQVFRHIKLPSCLEGFFSGLKISASYAVVGAVIAEWLGGDTGLGVYMTRVRKSYAYDKMFAVIIFISIISLLLIRAIVVLEKYAMPWKEK